jgi:hypothetical protein
MKRRLILLMFISMMLLIIPGPMVFAQTDYDLEDVEEDLTAVAQNLSNLFGQNVGATSFIGDPVGYATVPHFEIGIAGGAVFVPIKNMNADTDLVLDLGDLAYTPIPSIGAHAKVMILGFELGAKLGGIPPFEAQNENFSASINNLVLGGKLRYRVVDKKIAVLHFGVSVGGFYEFTRGNLALTAADSFGVFEDVNNDGMDEYIADVTTSGAFETEWRGSTFGGEAQANAKILFINLFGGARISTSFGNATTLIDGSSTLSAQPGYETDVTEHTNEIVSVDAESGPTGIDYYAFAGLEVKILPLAIGARGGYNFSNQIITLDIGARLQF